MEQENNLKNESGTSAKTENRIIADKTQEEQQLIELKGVSDNLMQVMLAMQSQTPRNTNFEETLADLKATAQALKMSQAISQIQQKTGNEKCGCNEKKPECSPNDCCCFDIVMTYVRVLAMQPLELDDSNANPWGEIEIKMFAYLDGGIGAVIPSMFSNLTLRKLIQHPGLKVGINRLIGTACLPKGQSKLITIGVDALEDDAGLIERATGGRDEEGSNSITMLLDCCCSNPITATMDINFTSGGQGGGAIEVGFTATRKN